MRSNNPKFHIVTKCCSTTVYRDKGSFQLLCSRCSARAEYQKIPNINHVLTSGVRKSAKKPVNKRVPTYGHKTLADFPPYRPAKTLSQDQIKEELEKRADILKAYVEDKTVVQDERKFIEERIKWNNDRIALLLG